MDYTTAEHPPAKEKRPNHIGIIMDGNGRWAKARHLPRTEGHRKGVETLKTLIRYCRDIEIAHLTVYAFSTENWRRPPAEISVLMGLFREYLLSVTDAEGVRTRFIGDRSPMESDIRALMEKIETGSANNTRMTLNVAMNYGGRSEIVKATREIVQEVQSGKLELAAIDEQVISDHLYTQSQPDPDCIIRPSGEHRLSNFLLWQSAYSEFIYMDVLWPDFSPQHLNAALWAYSERNRRFGGL